MKISSWVTKISSWVIFFNSRFLLSKTTTKTKKMDSKTAFSSGKSTILHISRKMRNAQNGKNEQTNSHFTSRMLQRGTVKTSWFFKTTLPPFSGPLPLRPQWFTAMAILQQWMSAFAMRFPSLTLPVATVVGVDGTKIAFAALTTSVVCKKRINKTSGMAEYEEFVVFLHTVKRLLTDKTKARQQTRSFNQKF